MASLQQLCFASAIFRTGSDGFIEADPECVRFQRTFTPAVPNGFTLIELMIVIAIIGIIVAVAVPNFLNFRNRAYCTQAEEDALSIASSISDYYAEPEHNAVVTDINDLSGLGNITGTISGSLDAIVITVSDPGNCPKDNVFQMTLPEDINNDGWW